MSMTAEDAQKFMAVEMGLRHHRSMGDLAEEHLYRSWIILAYEYAIRGELVEAVTRVRWCPQEYLRGTISQHMAELPAFRRLAYALSRILVDSGAADISDRIAFTNLTPARA